MSIDAFRKSRIKTDDIGKLLGSEHTESELVLGIPGFVYEHGLHIEATKKDFVLTIANMNYRDTSVSTLEDELYNWAVDEGYEFTGAPYSAPFTDRRLMERAIDAMLYFTSPSSSDIGSQVIVDTATGEFDGESAFVDLVALTQDDPASPNGQYLQVGDHRFDVECVDGMKFKVIDLDGLQRVAVEVALASAPDRLEDTGSPAPC